MIKKETFRFLADVAQHNDRTWFQANRTDYDNAKDNILAFAGEVINGLREFDKTLPPDLKASNCVMRIYRDVRFSKNKAPYKTNFGIAISAAGKNFNGPGYYLHIEPGKSFVGGGTWMPEAAQLKVIRQEIDYNGDDLLEILRNPQFKKVFGDLSTEDKLRSAPKGYDSDNPMIEYLKLKSFTAGAQLDDRTLQGGDAVKRIVEMFETLHPLQDFLRSAIV